jgi:methionine-rich copper-binding protein CopC
VYETGAVYSSSSHYFAFMAITSRLNITPILCDADVTVGFAFYKRERKVAMKNQHFIKIFLAWLLVIVLVACGGNSTPTPTPTDKTIPTLITSLPTSDAIAVPQNVKLAFNFSEAMDEDSLELSSSPSINLGTPSWTANSTGAAFNNETLAASTLYILTVKAKDVAGNALAETTISFTTSDSADTTAPTPPTGLIATPANGQVTLTWQNNPESDVAGYTVYVGTAQNELESTDFVTTNSKTITGLTNGTQYFFAVDAVDAANNHSGQTEPISATPSSTITDTTAPTIQASSPADGATDVSPRDTKLEVQFSEPMDKESLTFAITPRFGADDAPADEAFNIIWSENDTAVTLQPSLSNVVAEDTTFTLSVNAKDKAGNALSGDKEITFKTGFDVPVLVSSTPADGATNVSLSSSFITLTFSEEVDPNTFQFDSNFLYNCEGYYWELDNLTFNLDNCYLFDENTYTVFYKGKDLDGHPFAGSFSFSTIPDSGPPSVFIHVPGDGQQNTDLSQGIFIHFNDEMDEASTVAAISSSAPLGCTWELGTLKHLLSCRLTNLQPYLQPNTTYTITVAETAKDTSGHQLEGPEFCRGAPSCPYSFSFTTIKVPGELTVNITGAVDDKAKVSVSGPNGYNSGNLGSSETLTGLEPGTYTITAEGFSTGQPGKPTCRNHVPTPFSQTVTVIGGQDVTASVSYSEEPCEAIDP